MRRASTLTTVVVRTSKDFAPAFATLDAAALDGIIFYTDETTFTMPTSAYQLQRRLPVICEFEFQVARGCLFSYGPRLSEIATATAVQVDKILRGAKVAELPVHQMTRFELVVNKKTAAALGIPILSSILLRADKAID
nr:ABC transporter substrate binding protein [Variovorax sp. J22P168]